MRVKPPENGLKRCITTRIPDSGLLKSAAKYVTAMPPSPLAVTAGSQAVSAPLSDTARGGDQVLPSVDQTSETSWRCPGDRRASEYPTTSCPACVTTACTMSSARTKRSLVMGLLGRSPAMCRAATDSSLQLSPRSSDLITATEEPPRVPRWYTA